MARQDGVALIAPSYRAVSAPLPAAYAARLAPETSIVPYFALDLSLEFFDATIGLGRKS